MKQDEAQASLQLAASFPTQRRICQERTFCSTDIRPSNHLRKGPSRQNVMFSQVLNSSYVVLACTLICISFILTNVGGSQLAFYIFAVFIWLNVRTYAIWRYLCTDRRDACWLYSLALYCKRHSVDRGLWNAWNFWRAGLMRRGLYVWSQ